MSETFVDLHCHPSLKPYSKSFGQQPWGTNSADRKKRNSLWYYDSPNLFDRALQLASGISKFTQSDCTTLTYGNTRVVCAALYPLEKSFFANKLGSGKLSDVADNFIATVGKPRIDYIQGIKNYFEDLLREFDYFKHLHNVSIEIDGSVYKYVLAKNYKEVEAALAAENGDINTVYIILTIEGLHSLQTNYVEKATPDINMLVKNLRQLKQLEYPPFFVTFTHHFYNHLCGHAESFIAILAKGLDQTYGMNAGLTDAGRIIIKEALSTKNGKRIYIDIKHMSALTRKQYFAILATDFAADKIPVIASHGACNGLRSADEPVQDGINTSSKLMTTDLNFYDNEILMVAKTNGIFGLQLDERRIANTATLKSTKHSFFLNKIRHYRAELLWNQVQHIVELLDRHDLFAWDCIAIGSDYDGIINPLNGFITAETFPLLQSYLERYAFNYMNEAGKALKPYNQIASSEIVERIFSRNGLEFLKRWYV